MMAMLHPDNSCPSSSRAMLADRLRAWMPIMSVSRRTMTPLMSGILRSRPVYRVLRRDETVVISPLSLRTASE